MPSEALAQEGSTPLLRLPLSRHLLRFGDLCRRHSRGEAISAPGGAGAGVRPPPPRGGRCQVVPLVGQHIVLRLVHGAYFDVCGTSPALCFCRRERSSAVTPTYIDRGMRGFGGYIRRGDEHHAGEIVVDLEVVIVECMV